MRENRLGKGTITFEIADLIPQTAEFKFLFGCDGPSPPHDYSINYSMTGLNTQQYYIDCGYKELNIPAGGDGKFHDGKKCTAYLAKGNYMLIALPNIDGSFTCTLFFPFEGEPPLFIEYKRKSKGLFLKRHLLMLFR